jgi:hypothetical protein
VADAYARREPISLVYLIEQIQFFFNISVSRDTMGHIVKQMPTVKLVECIPMDRSRVMADPQAIDDFYANIRTLIIDVPRAFVFNMDESGFADYPDARRETVVVPADYQGHEIRIPFDRSTKRATLVAAIAANCAALKPVIVVPRNTSETELSLWGYDAQKVLFHYQEHGFITIKLFEKWLNEVLLHYVEDLRALTVYTGHAVLILDGCTCHTIEHLQDSLHRKGISLAPSLRIPLTKSNHSTWAYSGT